MTDVAIPVIFSILTAAMGYMAIYATLHPSKSVRKKNLYKSAFVVCGIASISLTGWQGARSNNSQKELRRVLDTIQISTGHIQQTKNEQPRISVTVPPPVVVTRADQKASPVNLFLDCRILELPISAPPGVLVDILDPGFYGGGFLQWQPAASDGIPGWIGRQPLERRIYRCDINNFSDVEVFNIMLPIETTLHTASWSGDDWSCSGSSSTRKTHTAIISALKRNGSAANFYVFNSGRGCAKVIPPMEASVDVGDKVAMKVRLRLGGEATQDAGMWLGPALR